MINNILSDRCPGIFLLSDSKHEEKNEKQSKFILLDKTKIELKIDF
jgi:hypothetical protein